MTDIRTAPEPRLPGLAAVATFAWRALAAAGVAAIAVGVIVLIWPAPTLVVAGTLFGVYLLISGIFQLTAAFGPHVSGSLRALHLLSGALSIALGLLCFRGPGHSVLLLALWIGFGWLIRGITELAGAAAGPSAPGRGWLAFAGPITAAAGVVLVPWPFDSIAGLALAVAVWLIVVGVAEIVRAIAIRARTTPHRR